MQNRLFNALENEDLTYLSFLSNEAGFNINVPYNINGEWVRAIDFAARKGSLSLLAFLITTLKANIRDTSDCQLLKFVGRADNAFQVAEYLHTKGYEFTSHKLSNTVQLAAAFSHCDASSINNLHRLFRFQLQLEKNLADVAIKAMGEFVFLTHYIIENSLYLFAKLMLAEAFIRGDKVVIQKLTNAKTINPVKIDLADLEMQIGNRKFTNEQIHCVEENLAPLVFKDIIKNPQFALDVVALLKMHTVKTYAAPAPTSQTTVVKDEMTDLKAQVAELMAKTHQLETQVTGLNKLAEEAGFKKAANSLGLFKS